MSDWLLSAQIYPEGKRSVLLAHVETMPSLRDADSTEHSGCVLIPHPGPCPPFWVGCYPPRSLAPIVNNSAQLAPKINIYLEPGLFNNDTFPEEGWLQGQWTRHIL